MFESAPDRRTVVLGVAAGLLAPGLVASAGESSPVVTVEMFDVDPSDPTREMVFSPRIVRVQPGTTVRFVAVDPSHNTVSTPGMIPEGAKPWRGPFGAPFEVTFTVPGYYGYHCLAHRGMGMVGLVVVEGDGDANLEAAKAVPQTGGAAKAWDAIWAELAAGRPQPGANAADP